MKKIKTDVNITLFVNVLYNMCLSPTILLQIHLIPLPIAIGIG